MEIRDTRNGDWHWVYNAVLADPHLSFAEKAIYSAISTFGGHQVIHPTVEQIAIRCSASERGVQEAIKKLEEVGYISIEKSTGRGNANVYYLLKKAKGCNLCTFSKGRTLEQEKVQTSAIKGANPAPHIDIYKDKESSAVAKPPAVPFTVQEDRPESTPSKPKDDYEGHYRDMCSWAEKRRGFKFVSGVKQRAALKKARTMDISPSRMKERWMELEGEVWRDGFDWTSVISSFDKRK